MKVTIERAVGEDSAFAVTNVLANGDIKAIASFRKAIVIAPAVLTNATLQPHVGLDDDAAADFKQVGSAVTLVAGQGVEFDLPAAGRMILVSDVGVEAMPGKGEEKQVGSVGGLITPAAVHDAAIADLIVAVDRAIHDLGALSGTRGIGTADVLRIRGGLVQAQIKRRAGVC